MAGNYTQLKSDIADYVKQNGTNSITGDGLQQQLLSMILSLGAGYQYMGVATIGTNPGVPDEKVFYIATQVGTYPNFGSPALQVADGEVAIFKWDSSWHKDVTGAATSAKLTELEQEIGTTIDISSSGVWLDASLAPSANGNNRLNTPVIGTSIMSTTYIEKYNFSRVFFIDISRYADDTIQLLSIDPAGTRPAWVVTDANNLALGYLQTGNSGAMRTYEIDLSVYTAPAKIFFIYTTSATSLPDGSIIVKEREDSLNKRILRNASDIAELDERTKKMSIPSFSPMTRGAKGTYTGNVGDTIAEAANNYRYRYTHPLEQNTMYAISDVRSTAWVTDDSGVILQRFDGVFDARNVVKFNSGIGTMLYVESYQVHTPLLYKDVYNDIVLCKGFKRTFTPSSALSSSPAEFLKEKPLVVPMSGSDSLTLSLDDVSHNVGLWLSLSYFDYSKITSLSLELYTGATLVGTLPLKASDATDPVFASIWAAKKWAFFGRPTADGIDSIQLVWEIETGESVNLLLYPYAIGDFLLMPTIFYNFEHWSNGKSIFEGFIDTYGLKVSVTGNAPSDASDIEWAQEKAAEGVLDFGIYGNELNDSADSLMPQATILAMQDYALGRIADKLAITRKVTSFGPQKHTIDPKAAEICRSVGLNAMRVLGGAFPFTDEPDSIILRVGYAIRAIDVVSYGFVGNFVHTYDWNPSGNTATSLPAVQSAIANHAMKCVTMQEMWENYRNEFLITEYE